MRINAQCASAFLPNAAQAMAAHTCAMDAQANDDLRKRQLRYLRACLDATELAPSALAVKAGVAPSTINRFIKGSVDNVLSAKTLDKLARASGVTYSTDVLPAHHRMLEPADEAPIPVGVEMPQDVPVLGVAQGGAEGEFELQGQVVDHVRRPPGIAKAKSVYAIYVVDNSMAPRFEHGELVYVHPGRIPSPGCDVVIQLKPKDGASPPRCFIKRLVRRTATYVECEQFNPHRRIRYDAADVYAIHRVLTTADLMGV